jgi:transposase
VQLVRAQDVKQAPGRPKTDKLDAVWLAKLTERGMLRPSFVPPAEIRQLRDYTRLRTDLTRERTRHYSRPEKLLEDDLLTELPDVAAAQEAQPSPQPTVGVSQRSRSPGRGSRVASLIATETGYTLLNHLPSFSSLPIFDTSRSGR